jgi:hypothetical protein
MVRASNKTSLGALPCAGGRSEDTMRTFVVIAAAGALLATATSAQAAPLPGAGGLTAALADVNLVEQAAVRVYVHAGRRYCFYFNGWHGPGWYRCGFAWRRGLGWGGVYGWNDWYYGPAYSRFHHGPSRAHIGVTTRSRTMTTTTRTAPKTTTGARTRSGAAVQSNTQTSGPKAGMRAGGGANIKAGTTGAASGGAKAKSDGSAKIQGGGAQMQGGASGGAAIQGGGEKKQ